MNGCVCNRVGYAPCRYCEELTHRFVMEATMNEGKKEIDRHTFLFCRRCTRKRPSLHWVAIYCTGQCQSCGHRRALWISQYGLTRRRRPRPGERARLASLVARYP